LDYRENDVLKARFGGLQTSDAGARRRQWAVKRNELSDVMLHSSC